MAITIAKTVANVIARGGGAFVSDDAGTTYYDLGRVKNVTIDASAVDTDIDTAGRTVQLAADVTLSATLTQTTDTEILNLNQIVLVASNGIWVKFTDEFTNAAGAGAAGGYLFKNVLFSSAFSLKFDQTESSITLTAKGRVSMTDLSALGTTQTLSFDA